MSVAVSQNSRTTRITYLKTYLKKSTGPAVAAPIAALLCMSLIGTLAHAQDGLGLLPASTQVSPVSQAVGGYTETPWHSIPGTLISQADGDDAYDPFADYSEFEESQDEEEDLNFFRNGRLLTVGFAAGYRGWTDILGKIYTGNGAFGLNISYFFDLRFAMQFGYMASAHTITLTGGNFTPTQGNVNISDLSLNLKYYMNTANVTRGLAAMNPFVLLGFSQIYRTITVSGYSDYAKDSAMGANFGLGLEIPIMRNKMYFGIEALYQYIAFADEGKEYVDVNNVPTGIHPRGDSYLALGMLGINF